MLNKTSAVIYGLPGESLRNWPDIQKAFDEYNDGEQGNLAILNAIKIDGKGFETAT